MIREHRPSRLYCATHSLPCLACICLAGLLLETCHPGAPSAEPEKPAAPEAVVDLRFVPLGSGSVEVESPAPGQTSTYGVAMAAGEIFHLRIEQRGLDVAVHWPEEPSAIDLNYGKYVPEELWWHSVAQDDIRFDIEVLAGRGDYLLVVKKLGPANRIDILRAKAFWQYRHTEPLADSAHPLDQRLTAATQAWRTAKAPVQEALAWVELAESRRDRGKLNHAIEALNTALELLGSTPERVLEARIRFERGNLYRKRGHFEPAVADLLAAAEVTQQAGDLYGLANAITGLAVARDERGELATACEGYQRAHRLFTEFGAKEIAEAQLKLGRCYAKLGSLPEAPAALLGALRTIEQLPNASRLRAEILREIGWWHRLERRPLEALSVLQQAFAIDAETSGIMDRLGTVYADLGELAVARGYYQQSLQRTTSDLDAAHVRLNLCRLEEQAGHVDAGLEQCHTALEVFVQLGATGSAAQALLLSARLARHRDLREAEALAERALSAIEVQRPKMGALEHRSAFFAERLDAHQLLIDIRMELDVREPEAGWDARALQVSELTRTRSLLDLLKGRDASPGARIDPHLERAEKDLRVRIDNVSRSLANEEIAEPARRRAQIAEQAVLEERLATTRERRTAAAALGSLARPCTLDVKSIQRLLDAETLLLVYHLGDSEAYLWTVDRDSIKGRTLSDRERIESLAESWYQLLSDIETASLTEDLERRRAHLLSEVLLAPITRELGRYRRLVIVADGVLLRIPFGALPSPGNIGGETPLIVDHEVVSLPSVGVLTTLRERAAGRRPANGLLAVVADPVYSPNAGAAPLSGTLPAVPSYPRLRGSAEEARALLDLAPSASTLLLKRFEASLDRVMTGALEGFRVVHFATHAETQAETDRPLGLVLSRFDANGAPVEGMLGLRELYTLRLPAELVVLSACGTALGEDIRGEGLVGLTRGFMHAGTPRIVVSLWGVRDGAARELMTLFYRFLLRDQLPPAEALRRARVEMWRAQWPPAAWAAFVFQGDWRPFPVTP